MRPLILDFDDFRESENALDMLFRMKGRWPAFKVTLFTIPMQCSKAFLNEVSKLPWIQLAVHGWEHRFKECAGWNNDTAETYLRIAQGWVNDEGKPIFVKGFKPPQWVWNQATVDMAVKAGYWLALNSDSSAMVPGTQIPAEAKSYTCNGPDIGYEREHGHIGCLDCHNDLRQIFNDLMDKYPENQEFQFIDEYVAKVWPAST